VPRAEVDSNGRVSKAEASASCRLSDASVVRAVGVQNARRVPHPRGLVPAESARACAVCGQWSDAVKHQGQTGGDDVDRCEEDDDTHRQPLVLVVELRVLQVGLVGDASEVCGGALDPAAGLAAGQ
jgi:hypothetical protein